MRTAKGLVPSFLVALFVAGSTFAQTFDVPLRINMGGPETVDSFGRTWLGDGPGVGDPLNIRPDDAGGTNTIENWCAVDTSLDDLGFDATHPGDSAIFSTIRWDTGADASEFRLELPIGDGLYLVNLYFQECCCPDRHFRIEIEDEVVAEDVSYLSYHPDFPALGLTGVISFPDVEVADGVLSIGLIGCLDPECPGSIDQNAIIDAIEVLSEEGCDHNGLDFNCTFDAETGAVNGSWNEFVGADSYRILKDDAIWQTFPSDARTFSDDDPGDDRVRYRVQALDGDTIIQGCECSVLPISCPSGLVCSFDDGAVDLSWSAPVGVDVTGYTVERNGALLDEIPGDALDYVDAAPDPQRSSYVITPLTNPPGQCAPMSCAAFGIPLRINLGGSTVVDSQGRTWLGDETGPGDILGIRPNDSSATNVNPNWCVPKSAETFARFGFDSSDANDVAMLTSIRWDVGADGADWRMEFTVPNNEYVVSMYFFECCCPNRHFKIEIEDEIVFDDVHSDIYDDDPPVNGTLGLLEFPGVFVEDGTLDIGLLPCPEPECPGATDINAILSALQVTSADCELDFRCPSTLATEIDGDGNVTGTWTVPCEPDGYELWRNGEKILDLPGDAQSFEATLTDSRVGVFELRPLGEEGCRSLFSTVANPDVPFEIPLRINMGGPTAVDSRGNSWFGDGGVDPLEIRPDDAGGTNTIVNWCAPPPGALEAMGFSAADPNDVSIFQTIRWDVADDDGDFIIGEQQELDFGDGGDVDFHLELPVPIGVYNVCIYFAECGAAVRSFQLWVQGELIAPEVNSDFFGRTGRICLEGIEVPGGVLVIDLPPCPVDCLGATDFNPIINAIEVLPDDTVVETCPRYLTCADAGGGAFGLSWRAPENVDLDGYDIVRNGELVESIGASSTTYEDEPDRCTKVTIYEVVPRGENLPCGDDYRMSCTVVTQQEGCLFTVPVRINMGGEETIDSHGNIWLGDRPCALAATEDPLRLREDELGPGLGGTNAICNWCVPDAAAIDDIGFDGDHPGDRHIFSTIRWDNGGDGIEDFIVRIPIEEDLYTVNLYFNECCCPARWFKISINGQIVDPDVNYLDYHDIPALGKVGVFTFEDVEAPNDLLEIGFFPCPECPGATDNNAIINAIEVLPSGPRPAPPQNVAAQAGADTVRLTWTAPAGVAVKGYNVYRVSPGNRTKLTPVPVPLLELNVTGLAPGVEVCFVVRTVNEDDIESQDSARVCATPGQQGGFRRGDTDGNGKLEITDPINNLSFQFLGTFTPPCKDAADFDDNGRIEITDPIASLSHQFLGQAPPPAPGKENCGPDPTDDDGNGNGAFGDPDDDLGCEMYPAPGGDACGG